MRKVRPGDVIDDFQSQLADLDSYFQRVVGVLTGTHNEKSDVSTLAEQTMVTLATALEGFLSDLFLAYLNSNSTKFQESYENSVRQSIQSKYGIWHADRLTYSTVRHIKLSDLQLLIDPTGWNVTFKEAQMLKTRAAEWLIQVHRNRVNSLSIDDDRVIDTVKVIRDFIAHRSRGAKDRMNTGLEAIDQGPPNQNLGRGDNEIQHVGPFLKAVFGTRRRLQLYGDRLREIANKLRP